jgi:hypothetical protein
MLQIQVIALVSFVFAIAIFCFRRQRNQLRKSVDGKITNFYSPISTSQNMHEMTGKKMKLSIFYLLLCCFNNFLADTLNTDELMNVYEYDEHHLLEMRRGISFLTSALLFL